MKLRPLSKLQTVIQISLHFYTQINYYNKTLIYGLNFSNSSPKFKAESSKDFYIYNLSIYRGII